MPLTELDLVIGSSTVPASVRSFLREASQRIDRFRFDHRIPGFIPSDYQRTYAALRGLTRAEVASGNLFCEWGSGLGVVTCLAAMLGYEAHGIEIEEALVDAARELADDFDLPAEFICGSYIPPGEEVLAEGEDAFAWLTTSAGSAHAELGLQPDEFDIIFAYPWPDEEGVTADLFEHYAGMGAVLLTYHGMDGLRLRRKTEPD